MTDRRPNMVGSSARRMRRAALVGWLGIVLGTSGAAQAPVESAFQAYVRTHIATWRLTVQPHQLAIGTRTAQAGDVLLDPLILHVPPQCVGTRRCPLVVAVATRPEPWAWQSALADRYGMLVLRTKSYADSATPSQVDTALRVVLRTYAVDPDKLALLSNMSHALAWGHLNGDVFSRIATIDPLSNPLLYAMLPPANSRGVGIQFFVSGALEDYTLGMGAFRTVQALRDSGYVVKHVLSLKSHLHRQEDYEAAWRWLADSWATPDPGARPQPKAGADSLPQLTTEVLARMQDFWHRFVQLPDSIGGMLPPPVNAVPASRKPFLEEVPLMVGHFPVTAWMTSMPKLAAHNPAVAAALKAAGLSAEQHDANRAALVSALATWNFGRDRWPGAQDELNQGLGVGEGLTVPPIPHALLPDSASVLGRNVAFLEAHRAQADSLIWWETLPSGGAVVVGPTLNP